MAVVGLASRYGRYGYRRVSAMLGRDGWSVNHKRVERIWRQEGLKVSAKQPKRGRLWLNDGSCVRLRPERQDHVWAYNLGAIRTRDGRPVRLLRRWMSTPGSVWPSGRGARCAPPTSLSAWETSWWRGVYRNIPARKTGPSLPPGRCVYGYGVWEPRHSSPRRGVPGRTGTWRASTESQGMNSWIERSSIPSGRCRRSRSCGAKSTTMSVPTVGSAIGHLLQRPPSPHPPLLQPRSVSHNSWYNYRGKLT